METLLKFFKNKFTQIIQFALWVFSILASFIFPPQINNYSDDASTITNLAKFALAILIGFLIIPFTLYKKRKHMTFWLIISISSFVIGFTLYYYYDSIRQTKRVEYHSQFFAIGNDEDLTPAAIKLKEEKEPPKMNNSDMIKYFAPKSPREFENIWNADGIKSNRLLIISVYLMTLLFFTICMLTLVQTLKCLFPKD